MNYALSGGGALFMGMPATESQLDKLFAWIKKGWKKLEALCTALNKNH